MATEPWVVYATFDTDGLAAPFVEDQLVAYRQLGFQTLVIDTSPQPSGERIAAWQRSSTAWQWRANVGYDFMSYRVGLDVLLGKFGLSLAQLDLLLTNDSCYGPYSSLADIFKKFDAAPRDGKRVFGMTDSEEKGYHLQSYWMYFRSDVVEHAFNFLAKLDGITERDHAVEFGELGLSRYLLAQGCELAAFRSNVDVVKHFARFNGGFPSFLELAIRWWFERPRYTRDGDQACLRFMLGKTFSFNPMLAFGSHLHFESMLPFVKRQLIRENPKADPFVPATPPPDLRDNHCVARWLQSSRQYRRRYGG